MVATPALLSRNNPPKRAAGDSYEEFHPYGTTSWVSTAGVTVSLKRYKFTGMERDDDTGLQCHGVRHYAPWLGRWTSADPIGLGDGVNRYCYCHGGPVGGSDPGGMEELEYPTTLDILLRRDTADFRWIGDVLVRRTPPPDHWEVGGTCIYRSDFIGPLPAGARRGVEGGVMATLPNGTPYNGEEGGYLWALEAAHALDLYQANALPVPVTLPVMVGLEAIDATMETKPSVLIVTQAGDQLAAAAALPLSLRPTRPMAGRGETISPQKQARHIFGTKAWGKDQGGYFLLESEAQAVLDAAHSGRAEYLGTSRSGNVVVRYREVVGFNNNPGAGFEDQATDVFMIKGFDDGVSVVPIRPDWSPE